MKLFYATSNKGKIYNMRRILKDSPIEMITPNDLGIRLEVEEDGKTTIENAVKKARAYYDCVRIPTLAGDSSMYIDGLPEERQPGLYVKRVGGKELTEEEAVEHYSKLAEEFGGRREAWNVTGLALVTESNMNTVEIEEDRAILTSHRDTLHSHKINPLDVITIDCISGKYYSEMTDEEISRRGYKFDVEVLEFLKKHLL